VLVALISTYDLGRQPFGLASPAAWLRDAGFDVASFDLSRQPLDQDVIGRAGLIGFFLPMHTATRLVEPVPLRGRGSTPPDRCPVPERAVVLLSRAPRRAGGSYLIRRGSRLQASGCGL
jgi:hypothetical protein